MFLRLGNSWIFPLNTQQHFFSNHNNFSIYSISTNRSRLAQDRFLNISTSCLFVTFTYIKLYRRCGDTSSDINLNKLSPHTKNNFPIPTPISTIFKKYFHIFCIGYSTVFVKSFQRIKFTKF